MSNESSESLLQIKKLRKKEIYKQLPETEKMKLGIRLLTVLAPQGAKMQKMWKNIVVSAM